MTARARLIDSCRAVGIAVLLAATSAPSAGWAQEQVLQTFVCERGEICRVRCTGLPDVSRVQRVVAGQSSWAPDALMLTVTYDSGTTMLLLRGDATCRMDNLTAAGPDD